MKVKRQRKQTIIVLLFILFASIGLGYAFLSTNLTINGTGKIKGNTWDIHFDRLSVMADSVALSSGDSAATITNNLTEITYTITLKEPGDFYEFIVYAYNAGTINGMIDSVVSELNGQPITNLPSYMDYSVSYFDGIPIEEKDILRAGTTETYRVRLEYKKDIDATDLPSTSQSLSLSFKVNYVQADSSAAELIYTINMFDQNAEGENSLWLGEPLPNYIDYYYNLEDAMNARNDLNLPNHVYSDMPILLKHKVENGIVTESYIVYSEFFSLRGDKTYDKTTQQPLYGNDYVSPYYYSNIEILEKLGFPCLETTSSTALYLLPSGMYGFRGIFHIQLSKDGHILFHHSDTNFYCDVYHYGNSFCNFMS